MAGRRELTFDARIDDAGLWGAVLAHYCRCLSDNPAVQTWLVEHGVANGEVVGTFGLGFVDRTLGLTIPSARTVPGREIRERLQALGVLRESGHEQFRGCSSPTGAGRSRSSA